MSTAGVYSVSTATPDATAGKIYGKSLDKKDFPSFPFQSFSEAIVSLKDFFVKPSPRGLFVRQLHQKVQTGYKLTDSDITELAHCFKSREYKQLRGDISAILMQQSPENLNLILKKMIAYSQGIDPLYVVEKFKGLLTLQKVESAIQSEHKGFLGAFMEASRVSRISSNEINKKAEEKRATLIQTIQVTVENLLEFALDTVLKAFQIDSIGEETEDDNQAYFRIIMFTSIWGGLTTVFTSLQALLGSAAVTAAVASLGVLITGVVLFCYYKWLKPTPKECAPFTNLTTLAKKGELEPVVGRDAEIGMIMDALKANSGNTRRHPLVVAKPGSGKTKSAEGMAVKIARGDQDVPPELRGKQVFYINIAKLCSDSVKMGRNKVDVLAKVQKKMNKYKDDCIFVFDEFAKAFSDPNNQSVSANLLSFLDTSSQSFPYCVALTTDEEYMQYIASQRPVLRRTKVIPLDLMGKEATELVLHQMAVQEAPEIEIENTLFAKIYEMTKQEFPDAPQPSISLDILKDALNKVTSTKTDLQDVVKKHRLNSQLRQIEHKDSGDPRTFTDKGQEIYEQFSQSERDLNGFENIQKMEAEDQGMYFRWKRLQLNHRDDMYRKAIEITNQVDEQVNEKALVDFILKEHYLTDAIVNKVKFEEEQFHRNFPDRASKIDMKLIDIVIQERHKYNQAIKDANIPKIGLAGINIILQD